MGNLFIPKAPDECGFGTSRLPDSDKHVVSAEHGLFVSDGAGDN